MTDYHLRRHTVSRAFREEVLIRFPALGESEELRRIFAHLAFGTWRDLDDDLLLLPNGILCKLTNQERANKNNKFVGTKWLNEFSEKVFPIVVHREDFVKGKRRARRIANVVWPEGVAALIEQELRAKPTDKVFFDTGSNVPKDMAAVERLEIAGDAEAILAQLRDLGYDDAYRVLKYLNGMESNRFTRLLTKLDDARTVAEQTGAAINHNLRLLKAIADQSKPFYVPTKTATRLFSFNESFLRLSRSVRCEFTRDWISLDLRSAQLAIIASEGLWDVPTIREYLETGKSIWKDLSVHMGIPLDENGKVDEDAKATLKTAMYTVIFGGGKDRITRGLKEGFPTMRNHYKKFTSHQVISDLLQARARTMKKIETEGFVTDAFGHRIDLVYYGEKLPYKSDVEKSNVRSLMACQAQSYELAILMPIYELAEVNRGNHGFSVMMHLHDGVCIEAHHKQDRTRWTKKLKAAVRAKASSLSISTDLES